MRRYKTPIALYAAGILAGLLAAASAQRAEAETAALTPVKDNTLFQHDPNDPSSSLNSNGKGNFFAAGATRSRGQLQRGLLQFDFSGIPAGAVVLPGSAALRLYVVDAPRNDPTLTRPFWLDRLTGLAEPWGEGDSLIDMGSGAGKGTDAEAGDATWFHTQYLPGFHDPNTFIPGGTGYWSQMGALGDPPLDPWYEFEGPLGYAGQQGEFAVLSSAGMSTDVMVDDINAWLAQPASNFGWIVIGDETVDDPDQSSKRGFATREHETIAFRPLLTFEYEVVPEPGTLVLLAVGAAGWCLWRSRRKR